MTTITALVNRVAGRRGQAGGVARRAPGSHDQSSKMGSSRTGR
jgi:hypothetical protein